MTVNENWQGFRFFVRHPFDPQASIHCSKRRGYVVKIRIGALYDHIQVFSNSGRSVGTGCYAADNQVTDTRFVQSCEEILEV